MSNLEARRVGVGAPKQFSQTELKHVEWGSKRLYRVRGNPSNKKELRSLRRKGELDSGSSVDSNCLSMMNDTQVAVEGLLQEINAMKEEQKNEDAVGENQTIGIETINDSLQNPALNNIIDKF